MRRCVIEGCNKKHHARGLCGKHYQEVRRHGWIKAMTKGYGDVEGHGEMVHGQAELLLKEAA